MSREKWRGIIVVIGLVLVGLLSLLGFQRFVLGVKPANRQALYETQRELRKGMSKEEVSAIIGRHQNEHVRVVWSPEGDSVTMSTVIGLFEGCDLRATFSNDRLFSATIRGDDTPNQRLPDAPPDIE